MFVLINSTKLKIALALCRAFVYNIASFTCKGSGGCFFTEKKDMFMNWNALISRTSLLLCVVLLCVVSVAEEDVLQPMAGTGGVMRDAERRALNTEKPKREAQIPKMAKAAGTTKKLPADARKLGEIREIEVVGDLDFAAMERVDISGRLMKRLAGGERTKGEIRQALDEVKKELLNEGFYLVLVVPASENPYDPKTGKLAVEVDGGHFGKVNVRFENGAEDFKQKAEEGRWFSTNQILDRFRHIEENETFDYARLRRVLADVNSHPDLVVDTDIKVRPDEDGGTRYADLDLTVYDSIPFHGVWEVNNYGMEEIEEWQTAVTLQYLNLTKHDDVLTLSPSISFNGELASLAASYMLPHRWWLGGNTTLYGGYSYLDTDNIVPSLDLEGTGWFLGLQHSENIVDNDNHLLAGSVGLLWRYIEDQYSAYGHALNERSVSILPISAALSYTGRRPDRLGGRNFATTQVLFNIATFGDEVEEVWTDAEENYWIFRWQLARLQPLFGWQDAETGKELHQWTLFSKIEGQYSSDVLIPVEKLSLGGFNTVRGYHSRGYLGDYGIYGTEELRTPILVDGVASWFGDRTGKTPFDRWQGVLFTDFGWTAYNDLPSGYDDDEWLWSAGVGLRSALSKYSQFKVDLAFPLHNGNNDDDDDMEIYVSVQLQF